MAVPYHIRPGVWPREFGGTVFVIPTLPFFTFSEGIS